MANAVVFLAVVRLAIAAFAHGGVQPGQLVVPRLDGRLTLVVLAVDALTDAGQAGRAPLEADAVELVAASVLAVAGRLRAADLLDLERLEKVLVVWI